MYTEQLSQALSPGDYILPTNAAAASYNSATPLDMSKFKRALYIINVGVVASGGTLDGRLQSCANSNFASGVHNLTSTNLTQVVASNTLAQVEVRADQVTAQNSGDRYVRLNTTVGTAAIFYSAVGLGGEAIQKPASGANGTIVGQTVVCST